MDYESKLMCPECGGSNVDSDGFCTDCGAKVLGGSMGNVAPVSQTEHYNQGGVECKKPKQKQKQKKKLPFALRVVLFFVKGIIAVSLLFVIIVIIYACTSSYAEVKQSKSQTAKQTVNTVKAEVSPDLVEFLDSYEEFVDMYCAFMKDISSGKKNIIDNYDEYSKMLTALSEYEQALTKINVSDLSTADYEYYIEVTARISGKLMNAIN
ncbi:MAG: hypothetical protein MJ153_03790 [Clostridia bacterium]|nr:hypothetical protein [Clostridia bacterium]